MMTTARQIADERLAKGEITKSEHAEIISTIHASSHGMNLPQTISTAVEPFGILFVGMLLLAATIVFTSLGGGLSALSYVTAILGIVLCGGAVYLSVTRLRL